jgi:hypothetical protein
VVYNRVKDLLDNGYRILGFTEERRLLHGITDTFRRENISNRLNLSFVYGAQTTTDSFKSVYFCNSTVLSTAEYPKFAIYIVNLFHPGPSCFFAEDLIFPENRMYHIFGYSQEKLAAIAQRLFQTGILLFNDKFSDFVSMYKYYKGYMVKEEKLREYVEPFKLLDWKVFSMFLIWVSLSLLSLFAFLLELICAKSRFFEPSLNMHACVDLICQFGSESYFKFLEKKKSLLKFGSETYFKFLEMKKCILKYMKAHISAWRSWVRKEEVVFL